MVVFWSSVDGGKKAKGDNGGGRTDVPVEQFGIRVVEVRKQTTA